MTRFATLNTYDIKISEYKVKEIINTPLYLTCMHLIVSVFVHILLELTNMWLLKHTIQLLKIFYT
jgi:hypothetical protein